MIKIIWNWIKTAVTPHRQKDEHLEMYEEIRSDKADKIRRKYGEKSE